MVSQFGKVKRLLNDLGYDYINTEENEEEKIHFSKPPIDKEKLVIIEKDTSVKEVVRMLTEQGIQEKEIEEALKNTTKY